MGHFPLSIYLSIYLSIIHGKRRAAKNAKGLVTPDPIALCPIALCNVPESEFLTGKGGYHLICECLGSCLVLECLMIKSSTLFEVECGLFTPYVHFASTSHDKCSLAFPALLCLLLWCNILNANRRTKTGEAWQ